MSIKAINFFKENKKEIIIGLIIVFTDRLLDFLNLELFRSINQFLNYPIILSIRLILFILLILFFVIYFILKYMKKKSTIKEQILISNKPIEKEPELTANEIELNNAELNVLLIIGFIENISPIDIMKRLKEYKIDYYIVYIKHCIDNLEEKGYISHNYYEHYHITKKGRKYFSFIILPTVNFNFS